MLPGATTVNRTLWNAPFSKNLALAFFTVRPILLHFWIPLIKLDHSFKFLLTPKFDQVLTLFPKLCFGDPKLAPESFGHY